jgi:hypothetical protein
VRTVLRRAALTLALLSSATPAHATFPKLIGARALPPGATEAGAAGALGNTGPDYWGGWVAARRGILRGIDVGARGGFLSQELSLEHAQTWVAGVDARVQVLRESIDIPIDFSVDLAWTVARPEGATWSDLAFAGLFGKAVPRAWLPDWVPSLIGTLGVELVFLGGSARPSPEETAAYGLASAEVRLGRGLVLVPEVKVGSDVVYGLALMHRF